jgi:hypothetical protein
MKTLSAKSGGESFMEFSPQEFSPQEKVKMLALKGVGITVVSRLEQLGYSSLAQLAGQDPAFITKLISDMIGSTCWHNSPMARRSIQAVIDLAEGEAG